MKKMTKKQGYTLIELLTVIAISAILFAIIAVPMIRSFDLTRAAQGFANAQQVARELVETIERDISNAAAVRDNTGIRGSLDIRVPDSTGAFTFVRLTNVKLDLFKPAAGDPGSRVGTAYIDPDTGKVDPTLTSPKGQPVLPAVPGDVVTRYFIARKDPFSEYSNPYQRYELPGGNLWLNVQDGFDNLYVLMVAEVPVYEWVNTPGGPQRIVNQDFFFDLNRDADPNTNGPMFDDPSFMEPSVWPTFSNAAEKDQMIRNWLNEARIITKDRRYDMIMPIFNKADNGIVFNGTVPQIVPLIRFQPSRVASEPAEGLLAIRPGEENANSAKIGPDAFRTDQGSLSNFSGRIWPSEYPTTWGPGVQSAGEPRPAWQSGNPVLDITINASGGHSLFANGVEVFNISLYEHLKSIDSPYPFSQSVSAAGLAVGNNAQNFIPVTINERGGTVVASFDVREFGVDNVPYDNRIPSSGADPGIDAGDAVTPATPGYQAGPGWETYNTVNERFARMWHQWDSLFSSPLVAPAKDGPQGVKRYIDLRVMPQFGGSGAMGPLDPRNGIGRAYITPGSEEIYGPDQNPGPNYGKLVRYTRVPNVDGIAVGPNQYKINYTDRIEPDWTTLGFAGANYDPMFYDPNSFLSAVLQARYRAGYIELNSRYGEPIPRDFTDPNAPVPGNIFVIYNFQFTEPNDVLAVDYDSAELMEVILTVRNYPQTSDPNPQMSTLRGSAAVRNSIR